MLDVGYWMLEQANTPKIEQIEPSLHCISVDEVFKRGTCG